MAKLKKAPLAKEDGTPVTSNEEALETLFSIHFPDIDIEKSNTEYEASNSETVPCKTPSVRMVNGQ